MNNPRDYNGNTRIMRRVHLPSSLSSGVSWWIWVFHAHSARTTALRTRMACSWTFATDSKAVASLRPRTLHSGMDRLKAQFREYSRFGTRHAKEFDSCTRMFTPRRSGVAPMLPGRGWRQCFGHPNASTGWLCLSTVSRAPPTTCSTGAARRCHCCPSSSPHTNASNASGRRIPGLESATSSNSV